jgi:hypothetical protein
VSRWSAPLRAYTPRDTIDSIDTKAGEALPTEGFVNCVDCVRPPIGEEKASEASLHAEGADPTDQAEAAAIRSIDYSPPPAGQPWRIGDYMAHKVYLDGLQSAALQRPPSWSGAAAPPSPGCWCSCCRGEVFERAAGGWCCARCHPALA